MDLISTDMVEGSVLRQLALVPPPPAAAIHESSAV
jgi:hypothetical protein